MTSAYSAFPNQGVRMTPLQHSRGHRSRRQHARAAPCRAARVDSRRHGLHHHDAARRRRPARHRRAGANGSSGRSAARPARPTTTPTRGSSASIPTSPSASGSASTRRSRSAAKQTGTLAALPIWIDIMKTWVERRRAEQPDPPVFERPGNVVARRQRRAASSKPFSPEPSRRDGRPEPTSEIGGSTGLANLQTLDPRSSDL